MSTATAISGHDEEELYWLALRLVPGLGTRRGGQLINRFRSARAIFNATPAELEDAGLSGALARSVASGCSFDDAATQQQTARNSGTQLVSIQDARYPELLRRIYDPPMLLFARGNVDLLNSVGVGVVGTRRPTPYGLAAAERLSGDLARAGVTVISGMARGIDTAAHKAALVAAEGPAGTIAVLGCGADVVYPSENRKLAAELAARALILSEFPMGATAFPQNFPIRNRIISGLSVGLLVVEGAQYSGSAITARLAMDQGRDVFAVPGNITSKMSWGTNLLIKQGAKLVQDWNDVVSDLPQEAQRRLIEAGRQRIMNQGFGRPDESSGQTGTSLEAPLQEPHKKVARMVLESLRVDDGMALDAVIEAAADTSPSEVIAALFELEILGLVRQLPGRHYVKVW